mmetsp:Transcript_36148/g.34195  ORF Transcript_36148/g.34195 Transcript_36148/m.34195 type:complete len:144 (-) Transcript_36148:384-815(-)|eukprot:CAMPEP_0119036540 /NCGR_PEP_ID=MMETSP1177-20130426/4320_1 /TAXON_ID=2985 /ORGANISM="Ochromonas sp, Strain CCMP1899" /LENGTH=143 /DNA_ID=CAMNT_0006996573 /DNA_START=21 /DNA_END=452 /DNA_ORIENTATION=+
MGAAGSVESLKPADASDVRNSGSLNYARNEIVHLRANLGKYALQAGFTGEVVYDGSDLCLGSSDSEDFDRCVSEISHIRQCLRLSTQGSRRATRSVITNTPGSFIEDEKKYRAASITEDKSESDSSDESSGEEEVKRERQSRK